VYDIDNATSTLDDDDFLGQMECTLGEVWKGEGRFLIAYDKKGRPDEEHSPFGNKNAHNLCLGYIAHNTYHTMCTVSSLASKVVSAVTYTKPLQPSAGKPSKRKLGTITVSRIADVRCSSHWSTLTQPSTLDTC